jgi:hypothetical protein
MDEEACKTEENTYERSNTQTAGKSLAKLELEGTQYVPEAQAVTEAQAVPAPVVRCCDTHDF